MTLAALFPLHSTRNDSECCIIEEDDEEDEETMDESPQTGDQIQSISATNLKSNMRTKSNPHELESPNSCSTQWNEMRETENKILNNSHERKRAKTNDKEDNSIDWDSLRRIYSNRRRKGRTHDAKDSLDWEAVRHASVNRVSNAISIRGMNNVLAARIKVCKLKYLFRRLKEIIAVMEAN